MVIHPVLGFHLLRDLQEIRRQDRGRGLMSFPASASTAATIGIPPGTHSESVGNLK